MELRSLPKLPWTSSIKDLPDQFSEMSSTADTRQGSVFSLVPHSLMDTISFIALKCTEERNIHYVFKMDASSLTQGLGWLRLVQAISSPEEQNLETCMMGAETHIRTNGPAHKEEKLLVWYDGHITRMERKELRAGANGKDAPPSKRFKRGINFHSLAQDVEREKIEQTGEGSRKSVLLEKTNCLDGALSMVKRDEGIKMGKGFGCKGGGQRMLKTERSAFTEVRQKRRLLSVDEGSAFSPVPFSHGYTSSAFRKPCSGCKTGSCDASHDVSSSAQGHDRYLTTPEYYSLSNTLVNLTPNKVWTKPGVAPHPPQLLPPTFTPLGATAQNWCANCKLSFRMTSDLVLHMRSRHKREEGGEMHRKKCREPELSCPVCYAYFRERHHLSRHMTSHC
ncbi:zinc finger protein 488 isoform 2-T2 [Discoglossus pictus]